MSDSDGVVEDNAVGVVDDLCLFFTDLANIDIMQANQPVRRFRHPGQAATGLRHHFVGAPYHRVELVDRLP